jgi:hypothetical protein
VAETLVGSKGTADFNNDRNLFVIKGARPWKYAGPSVNPYQTEHDDFFAAIRSGASYNEADYGANSTMTAIMGRMATYSGEEVEWERAFNCDVALAPSDFYWDMRPPVEPGADANYPVAHPGRTTAYTNFSQSQG